MSGCRMRRPWHPDPYRSPEGRGPPPVFIFPSLPFPQSPASRLPPHCFPVAAAAVRCQGNHSWLGGSPLHPIPPLLLSSEAGRSWDKARERRGAEGSWREMDVGPAPAVNLGCFSPSEAPSPLLGDAPNQPGERGRRRGQRGQAQFNTRNKLIHSRGRQ